MKIPRGFERTKVDRRVARTRALLQDALIALVPDRGYASITVEDICRTANVGRSTFYAHYSGKDELRSATIDAHLRSLVHKQGVMTQPVEGRLFQFSLPMLEHAAASRALHHALIASSDDVICDDMRERIRRAVRHEIVSRSVVDPRIPTELAVQFVTGAFLSVLVWWITTEAEFSPAMIDEMFQRMSAQGIVR
jgi:AcrR family transcriptional regulator